MAIFPSYDPAIYWVREREAVRVRKERGDPWPWTDDPILRDNRFCNVRREDDKVTRWIAQHIREPYAEHPSLWWMLCAARIFNTRDTLAELIEAGAWPGLCLDRELVAAVFDTVEARQHRGEKVYSAAYIVGGRDAKGSKNRYAAEMLLGAPWRDRVTLTAYFTGKTGERTLQGAHRKLTRYRGWGAFLAYQAVVDMRFTRLLRDAPDVENWAAAGVGTVRGLNRLHGRSVDYDLSQQQALSELREVYRGLRRALPKIPLDFSDTPNVMCEVDKMLRTQNGGGRMKQRYRAPEPQGFFC